MAFVKTNVVIVLLSISIGCTKPDTFGKAAIAHDSVSLPSWKVMVERNLLEGVPQITHLLYRTADDIAGDERRVAADNEDIALVRRFTELYVKLEPTYELLQLALEKSTVLYKAMFESDYSRILMPRLDVAEKENA